MGISHIAFILAEEVDGGGFDAGEVDNHEELARQLFGSIK